MNGRMDGWMDGWIFGVRMNNAEKILAAKAPLLLAI